MRKNVKHSDSLRAIISNTLAASGAGAPVIEIKNFALAGDGLARIVCDVTHTSQSRANPQVFAAALTAKLENKMSAVAGSFHSMDKGQFTERLTGLVGVVRKAISCDGQTPSGFRALASNMFMDEEEDMWVLRKTEAGDILVKTTGIDDDLTLTSLLRRASCSASATPLSEVRAMVAQASSVADAVEGGDFVSYVTQDNLMGLGYVVASVMDEDTLVVLSASGDRDEVIKRAAVTQVHDQAEFPSVEETAEESVQTVVAAAKGGIDLDYLLGFYRKVYARSPQFYQMFAQRLKSHCFC